MIGAIILQVVLICLNATFASAEIAVISMNETKLKMLAADGDKRAVRLSALTEQPARFLATIQVAITMASLLGSAYAADNFARPLVAILMKAGITIPEKILQSVAVFLITMVLAYFSLVFGELVPKRIAMKKPEELALGMAGMLFLVSKVFAPLVWILTISTNGILRLIGIDPNEDEDIVTEEEILMLLAEGNEKGQIPEEESKMIQHVFEFDDIPVEQICTRRREVVSLSMKDSMECWEEVIHENRHTFYPVCGEEQEDIIGVLDTKDYYRLSDRSREKIMECAVDQVFFIPESMKANVLFSKMKQTRRYFAVVIDEYGGLSGIITLHDLMEVLVGNLDDIEEPIRPKEIERIREGIFRIQGSASLDEVEEELKIKLPTEDYDTFSGFICGMIGRIPDDGEQFELSEYLERTGGGKSCRQMADQISIEVRKVENHVIVEAEVSVL